MASKCRENWHAYDSVDKRDCSRPDTAGKWYDCAEKICPNRYLKPYTQKSTRFLEPKESQIEENPEPSTSQVATPPVSQSVAAKTAAENSENSESSEDEPEPTMAATTATTNLPIEALKIFIPSPYDGTDPRDADRFIAQCLIWFKKAKITDKDDKIGEALSLMKGRAMTWATPHLVQWSENKAPFETWKAFATAFEAHFGNIDDAAKAIGELGRLCRRNRNNSSVSDFAVEFENLSMRTSLSATDLHARFKEGLPDCIQKALAMTGRGNDSVNELKRAALTIDQEYAELDQNEQRRFFRRQKR